MARVSLALWHRQYRVLSNRILPLPSWFPYSHPANMENCITALIMKPASVFHIVVFGILQIVGGSVDGIVDRVD